MLESEPGDVGIFLLPVISVVFTLYVVLVSLDMYFNFFDTLKYTSRFHN